MVAFLLDENIPRGRDLARGLTLNTFTVHAVGDGIAPGRASTDETLVDWCIAHDAVLVTADHGRKNREMVDLLRARNVRCLLVPAGMTPRAFVTHFVKHHLRIEEDADRRRACRYRLGKGGRLGRFD